MHSLLMTLTICIFHGPLKVAETATSLAVLFLWRTCCFPVQCGPGSLQTLHVCGLVDRALWDRCNSLRVRYQGYGEGCRGNGIKTVIGIDGRILGRTTGALGDDESLGFIATIPGFNRKLAKGLERNLPLTHLDTFWRYVGGPHGLHFVFLIRSQNQSDFVRTSSTGIS